MSRWVDLTLVVLVISFSKPILLFLLHWHSRHRHPFILDPSFRNMTTPAPRISEPSLPMKTTAHLQVKEEILFKPFNRPFYRITALDTDTQESCATATPKIMVLTNGPTGKNTQFSPVTGCYCRAETLPTLWIHTFLTYS